MKALEICRRRMASQFLLSPGAGAPEVVRALGAVQAQDFPGAKWALGQRTRGLTDAAIERDFAAGRIIRTHVLRPTWHFVAPEDIRWMLALTAPRVNQAMAFYNRYYSLTPAVFRRSNDAIAKALEGGRELTRPELATVLQRAHIKAAGSSQQMGHLMMHAELDAVVCSGPRRGKQFTYTLLDERVPRTVAKPKDESLHELTHRYFTTRGPATVHDFSWWSGLTVADVKHGIAMQGPELEQVTDDVGKTYWIAADAPEAPRPRAMAQLLPNYDEYFIGFKDRGAIGARVRDLGKVTGGNALIAHGVFIGGQLVGGWKRLNEKDMTAVQLDLIARLTPAEKRLVKSAAADLARFIESPVEIRGLG